MPGKTTMHHKNTASNQTVECLDLCDMATRIYSCAKVGRRFRFVGIVLAPWQPTFVVDISAWRFRRNRFGGTVSAETFRRGRFGDVKMSCS